MMIDGENMDLDFVCIGELLIDFIAMEASDLTDASIFMKFPGGAAGNVAVGLSNMGLKAGVISKVGKERFGDFIIKTLNHYNVDSSQIHRDDFRKTGLAFVALNEKGVPEYTFYRDPCASMFLKPEEVKPEYIKKGKGIYFSSMSLINEPVRSANYKAVHIAKKHKLLVTFDPNVRISLWESEEKAKTEIKKILRYINILKINTDELNFLWGERDKEKLCKEIIQEYSNIRLLALTLGENGCLLMNSDKKLSYINAFNVDIKDTTGAGDAFFSALVNRVIKIGNIDSLDDLYNIGKYANAAAALTIKRPGVITAIPTEIEIQSFLLNTD